MSTLRKGDAHTPSFLHLKNLCAQVLNISHVMTVVVKTVNAIKHNTQKHRLFQQYLQELVSEYGDVLCFQRFGR